MNYIQDGPHCGKKWTKQCQSSPTSSIPCTPRWVSMNLSDIWCSSTVVVYIDTSRHKWIFCKSHPWAQCIDMLSKLSRILNKRRDSLGLQTPHSRSKVKVAPNHRKKGRERMDSFRTTSLNHKQRSMMGRQRNTSRNGVSSIRAPGIKPLNVVQRSHWWPS
jgi:hypothetical protein